MSDETAIQTTNQSVGMSISPKDLQDMVNNEQQIRAIYNKYIADNFVEGVDYGRIAFKDGKESKSTLFQPGAEKFCNLMHITPTFRRDDDTYEMAGKPIGLFCYVCNLTNNNTGQIVGEGRGAASTQEKKYQQQVAPTGIDFNTAIKISQKRALVDAVKRTGALSDQFTQDVEDLPDTTLIAPKAIPTAPTKTIPVIPTAQPAKVAEPIKTPIDDEKNAPICPNCGVKLEKRYSKKNEQYFWGCPNWPKCNKTAPYKEEVPVKEEVVDNDADLAALFAT